MKHVKNSIQLAVTLAIVAIFMYSILGALDKYNEGRIAIVTSEREFDTVQFPAITICKKVEHNRRENETFPLIGHSWQRATVNGTRIKIQGKDLIKWKKLGLQNPWTNASIYSKYFVSSRICWIYYAEVPSGISDKFRVYLNTEDYPSYEEVYDISLADPWADIKSKANIFGKFAMSIPAQQLPNSSTIYEYTFDIIEKKFLPRKERPCIEESDKEDSEPFANCIWRTLGAKYGCSSLRKFEDIFVICNSTAQREIATYWKDNLSRRGEEKVIQLTGCKPPCKLRYFQANPPLVLRQERDGDDRYGILMVLRTIRPTIQELEEVYLYDGNNLSADVGGFLGMLLGISCLSMLGQVIKLAEWFLENCRVNRKQAEGKNVSRLREK